MSKVNEIEGMESVRNPNWLILIIALLLAGVILFGCTGSNPIAPSTCPAFDPIPNHRMRENEIRIYYVCLAGIEPEEEDIEIYECQTWTDFLACLKAEIDAGLGKVPRSVWFPKVYPNGVSYTECPKY